MTTVTEAKARWTCKCRKQAPETFPTSEQIYEDCRDFILSDATLKKVSSLFTEEVNKGLSRRTHHSACVKCYVTYVQDLPKGNENGMYLGMYFGDTNLRLVLCEISDEGMKLKNRTCPIPEHALYSTGAQLFDHIAEHLARFLKDEDLARETILLAFTFGFPIMQWGLRRGVLFKWSKGFKCSNVVGHDVVHLLKDAIERRGDIDVDICAIINDTTGTLISCAFDYATCKISSIICRGTNACYVEKQKNAELFDDEDKGSGVVLINTEWAAFGDNGALNFIQTSFDHDIDEASGSIGKDVFEKMVAGMNMGELVRMLLVHFTRDGYLFKGKGTPALYTSKNFPSSYVYAIESDSEGTYTNCREVLQQIGLDHASKEDCINVRFICECVSRRSARLCAAALAALVNKVDEPFVTIGIDGSVYNEHPHFHHVLFTTLQKLVKKGIKCDIVHTVDGSGRGAALLASALSKSGNEQQ